MLTRGIKNCRVSALYKGCSPLQLLCNLIGKRPQSATFHTATVSHKHKMNTLQAISVLILLTINIYSQEIVRVNTKDLIEISNEFGLDSALNLSGTSPPLTVSKNKIKLLLMNRLLILLTFSIVLNSCATITNSPFQKIHIKHDPELNVKVDTSKFFFRSNEVYNVYIPKNYVKEDLFFLRSRNEIPLIINDTVTFMLKPHRSYFTYWFGNIYFSYGLGMLIDYQNDKSFSYPFYNYITKVNDQIKNVRFKPIPKNKVRPTIATPLINVFYLQTDSGKVNLGSGLGLSVGLDYFIKEKTYMSFTAGVTLDCFSPRHDTINDRFESEYFHFGFGPLSSAKYVSLKINRISPWLEYGAGVTITNLKWGENQRTNLTDSTYFYTPIRYSSLNLGLSSDLKLRLTPNFNIGILYQPLFYDFKHKRFNYQHYINTELIWRF